MSDIALVVFEREKEGGRQGLFARVGFLKLRIGTALFHLFNKKQFINGINRFEIAPGLGILLIKLPIEPSLLSKLNKGYLEDYVSGICLASGCKSCFVPSEIRKSGAFEAYMMDTDSRAVIFKALLVPMLEEIYTKGGVRLDNLDIAFVHGEDSAELLTMVRQLEPFVRYISVAASDKMAVESGLSDICADSGVSIFVGGDFKSILRNADLIINLGGDEAISKYRIKPRTLVINFSGDENQRLHGEFVVIKGVEYRFPAEQYHMLGEDIQRSFVKTELAEILMAFKTGLLNGRGYSDATAAEIVKTYGSGKCSVTGFVGRRGVLKADIMKQVTRTY